MSHKAQVKFCKQVKRTFPAFFKRKNVVDVGSLDINGSNKRFFSSCRYRGIDLMEGKNVDVVGPAHEKLFEITGLAKFKNGEGKYAIVPDVDTIISTEALEHDESWPLTLTAMYRCLKSGGLLLITCAGDGREEHGTYEHHAWTSPATNHYYKNISNEMFTSVLNPELFSVYHLAQVNTDLQFFGIKK